MKNKKSFLKKDVVSIVIVVVFSVVVVARYINNFGMELSTSNADWGTFGDYIGGTLNPVIAGFAFYWIIQSYRLQKDELSDTRQLLQHQNSVLNKQNFESMFFQLMSLLNELIKDLSLTGLKNTDDTGEESPLFFEGAVTNRKCFEKLHDILMRVFLYGYKRGDSITDGANLMDKSFNIELFDSSNRFIGRCNLSTQFVIINSHYDNFYYDYGHIIGHYFRTVYNIIKFVDTANIEETQKKIYTNLVRAQLSKFELGLLFYNSINPKFGSSKFLPLIKKYDLLKHLEDDVLACKDDKVSWVNMTSNIDWNSPAN